MQFRVGFRDTRDGITGGHLFEFFCQEGGGDSTVLEINDYNIWEDYIVEHSINTNQESPLLAFNLGIMRLDEELRARYGRGVFEFYK